MKRGRPLSRRTPLRTVSGMPRSTKRAQTRPKYDPAEKPARGAARQRSGGLCELCGLNEAHEWHHRQNRSQGGIWSASNGMHLCSGCHKWVTEHPEKSYRNGWSVKSTDEPLETPLLYRGRWVLLDDVGGIVPTLPFEEAA